MGAYDEACKSVGVPIEVPSLSAPRKFLQKWTFALIYQAASRGLVDISTSAGWYVQVEEGQMDEHHVRMMIRHMVRGADGLDEPLLDVDAQYMENFKAPVEKAITSMASLRPMVDAAEQCRMYSE